MTKTMSKDLHATGLAEVGASRHTARGIITRRHQVDRTSHRVHVRVCIGGWKKRQKLGRMTIFTRTIYRAYTMDLSGLQPNMSCIRFVVADSLATKLTRVFLISW